MELDRSKDELEVGEENEECKLEFSLGKTQVTSVTLAKSSSPSNAL